MTPPAIQAALVSMLTLALFLDMLTHRKQVWLVVGLAAGLLYLARQARETAAREAGPEGETGRPHSEDNSRTSISGTSIPSL